VDAVALGFALRVDVRRRHPVGDAVEHDRVPALPDPLVVGGSKGSAVVMAAGQCERVDVGLTALDPVGDVVQCR
jgi:hypothetical protein